jgi:CelD/BcsL family acetyltransferase involved in cellulose biosynthesis
LNLVPYRVLRILGDFPTGAEYLDWIVDKDQEAEVTAQIGHALSECRDRWDGIWIPYVSGWTGATERIERACEGAGLLCRMRPARFAYLDLPRTFSEFLDARSGHWRHELRRKERKVFNQTGVSFDRCNSEDDLPAYLDGLFGLHYLRWQLKGEQGAFRRKPNEARFYRRFAPIALRNGWLRLYAIRERGAFKVSQVGYAYNGVLHGLQDGFDPAFAPGAGIVLRGKVIDACISEGLHGYDFLGEMSDHKARWLAAERIGQHMFIVHRGLKGRILQVGDVWPSGRYLRREQNAERLQTGAGIPGSGPATRTD